MTSKAIGTGMNTETRLSNAIFGAVTCDNSESHGIKVSRVADRTLARSMIVIVGLSSIQMCLLKSTISSFNTVVNLSWQSSGGGTWMAQEAPSSPTVKTWSGFVPSSHRVKTGTTTVITRPRNSAFVTATSQR